MVDTLPVSLATEKAPSAEIPPLKVARLLTVSDPVVDTSPVSLATEKAPSAERPPLKVA